MKKNKKEKKEPEVRPLTPEELEAEEKRYQACKKPVQVGWAIYAFAATLYLCSGFFASRAAARIPEKKPITESLSGYRESEEYNDFIRETQMTALDKLTNGEITLEIAKTALSALEIDELGLDNIDRKMLETIIKFYDGGPVGLETLAATIGEEAITIEDVYEPYLMQIGFLNRTPRGRCVTRLAYEHLGIPFKGQVSQIKID